MSGGAGEGVGRVDVGCDRTLTGDHSSVNPADVDGEGTYGELSLCICGVWEGAL